MKIAISCGDPAGIGPEIVNKALSHFENDNIKFRYFCNSHLIEKLYAIMPQVPKIKSNTDIIDIDVDIESPKFGKASPEGGEISWQSFIQATEDVISGHSDAIVTAPINKYSWKLAGFDCPGHTDKLAEIFRIDDFAMAFIKEPYRLILQTIHEPLSHISTMITSDSVYKKIIMAADFLNRIGEDIHIDVLGLNPHAGEKGKFGHEEKPIKDAIIKAQNEGIDCYGPHVPDAFFTKWQNSPEGMVIAMYHDQGLIPFKMISKGYGVNTTLGLPIIRTSPEHGTAMDIAGKNLAYPTSMIEAIKLAIKLHKTT
ncbi:MAG: 4-hydroxythreonine-4-phosphate dehydrogenase PdxA [Candidatus Zixiibacteriota bacterium]